MWPLWKRLTKPVEISIESLVLEKTPLFRSGVKLYFGHRTVILGNNQVGKTAITEWLSALQDVSKLERWMTSSKSLPIVYSIITNGKPRTVRISIQESKVTYSIQGATVPDSLVAR